MSFERSAMNIPNITELFDLSQSVASPLFHIAKYPWDVLDGIEEFISNYAKKLSHEDFFVESGNIIVSKRAKISKRAEIAGPCIIGHGTEIRPFAYIRKNCVIGERCVIGNSTEIKNSIIFNGAKLPHYNYVGDSVIGHMAHFGASAIASNVKSDKSNVSISICGEKIQTNRSKLGSLVADHAEIGCACVLNPGCIIGRNSIIYPNSSIRGYIPENTIFKSDSSSVTRIQQKT